MKYSNELKVGMVVVVCALLFFIGIRYFEDLPLFGGTNEYYTLFNDISGLQRGSVVTVKGVNVGRIEGIAYDPATDKVLVRFSVDETIPLPEGSRTSISGIAALGSTKLSVRPGQQEELIPPGEEVPSREQGSLEELTDDLPGLVTQLEAALQGAGNTFAEADVALEQATQLLASPRSDLNQTLAALRRAATSLDQVLAAEQARVEGVLVNLESVTGELSTFTSENADSVAVAVQNASQTLRRINQNLDEIEGTVEGLDAIIRKVNEGEGTLGLLVNDPSLYQKLDSAATNLNLILADFEEDPARYLRQLRLVDIF